MEESDSKYKDLNPQYRLFVDCYTDTNKANFNQTEAARQAGYSDRSARLQGYRLMQNDNIRAAIKEKLEEHMMSADEALKRLGDIARGSIDLFFDLDDDGYRLNLHSERAKKNIHLIKAIVPTRSGTKLEMHDAHSALVDILKIHGEFVNKHEHSGPGGGPIPIKGVDTTPYDGD